MKIKKGLRKPIKRGRSPNNSLKTYTYDNNTNL